MWGMWSLRMNCNTLKCGFLICLIWTLEVTMGNTLSWNNHINLLMKKLSIACYIIRNAKTYMSVSLLKRFNMLSFTQLWVMELYSGENCHIVPQFLKRKKWQLELWKDEWIEFHVEIYLRNYIFCPWHHNICYLY
jgi:hypothetical protein